MTETNPAADAPNIAPQVLKTRRFNYVIHLTSPALLMALSLAISWSEEFIFLVLPAFLLLIAVRVLLLARSVFPPWRNQWRHRFISLFIAILTLPLLMKGAFSWGDDVHLAIMLPTYMSEIHADGGAPQSFDWGLTGWAGQEGQRTLYYDPTDKTNQDVGFHGPTDDPLAGWSGIDTETSHLFGHFYLVAWSEE